MQAAQKTKTEPTLFLTKFRCWLSDSNGLKKILKQSLNYLVISSSLKLFEQTLKLFEQMVELY